MNKSIPKSQIALQIYKEEYKRAKGHPERKVLMVRFIEEAGLTKAGASTYISNIRKKWDE